MPFQTIITKKQALKVFKTQYAMAKALGLTRQAVSKWPDGPIPELQAMRLRFEICPDDFDGPPPIRSRRFEKRVDLY